ncbi:15-hydroxyprostaglandin dehydrogenase (Nad(+)) protein [Mycena sanguinolenta]|uniref:15-hydroxyprostaglandin dehydrogenase (Nad(+)) protein n=1 Tax=Mycena sanguinolenta TaxID=230812 RepID=A0A8H7DGJ3_9AGAR|nr:15-hydroxyprostaglandin dehydrogenase (Nad(+)) protein [Mycena sanguinolenta]
MLQHRFDVWSSGGNLTSNIYYDFNERQELEYSFTVGMSEIHRETERWNATLFVEMERKAIPVYHLMVEAIEGIEAAKPLMTVEALRSANSHLKGIFKYFFDNLTDSNISRELWMAYVQGPHGWALDGMDGVSGGQSLVIRTVDAFLDIQPFPALEVEGLHLPRPQRNWLNTLREYNIRAASRNSNYKDVDAELEGMVKHLRIWRMGHMRRMVAYESIPRPERQKMTAGRSLVAEDIAPDEDAMVHHLTEQLALRLKQTK